MGSSKPVVQCSQSQYTMGPTDQRALHAATRTSLALSLTVFPRVEKFAVWSDTNTVHFLTCLELVLQLGWGISPVGPIKRCFLCIRACIYEVRFTYHIMSPGPSHTYPSSAKARSPLGFSDTSAVMSLLYVSISAKTRNPRGLSVMLRKYEMQNRE